MALKALDKMYESFVVGDIVVNSSFGDTYGVKLLKKVYIEETNEYHFICSEGDVRDDKFVESKSSGGPILSAHTAKTLRGYGYKWTPGETYKSGDILKDQDNVLFLVAGDKVWNLTKGTQTTQARWESSGTSYGARKFTKVRTAGGDDFSTVVKVEDVKSTW